MTGQKNILDLINEQQSRVYLLEAYNVALLAKVTALESATADLALRTAQIESARVI